MTFDQVEVILGTPLPSSVQAILEKIKMTFVNITETGFTGDGDELVQQVTDSTGGFTLVLASLNALLEHNFRLNLVADRFPTGIAEH